MGRVLTTQTSHSDHMMTFAGLALRICLFSNLVLMSILVYLQLSSRGHPKLEPREVQGELNPAHSVSCPKPKNSTASPSYLLDGNNLFISKDHYRKANPYATDPDDPDPVIYITSWTEIQPGVKRWFQEGKEQFNRCPNLYTWMKCHYSLNKNMFNRSHAVMFHVRHMSKSTGVPKRLLHQKWVFYEVEAPPNVWNYASPAWAVWNLFNLTATFTKDSNIPYPLHEMNCRPKANWKPSGINYAANKTKKIAWFVSHCNSSSRRELYVQELNKYIPVDIYGMCGNTSVCNRDQNANNKSFDWEQCMLDFLGVHYKFYLSFENAFCMDYVTEKLHRIYPVNVIPIVLGQVDYENFIPKGTYINTRNFDSPQHLAKFLKHLDERDHLYNKYLETKNSYECRGRQPGNVRFHCKLCEYLHLNRHRTEQVYDAQSFWSVQHRCTSPVDFYQGMAKEIIPSITYTSRPDLFL